MTAKNNHAYRLFDIVLMIGNIGLIISHRKKSKTKQNKTKQKQNKMHQKRNNPHT